MAKWVYALAALICVLPFTARGDCPSPDDPQVIRPAVAEAPAAPAKIKVIVDGSGSIAGYFHTARAGTRSPYTALMSNLRSELTGVWPSPPDIEFYRFGKQISRVPKEHEAEIANERFYTHRCLPLSGRATAHTACDVDESQIGVALSEAEESEPRTVSMVMTDLFLTAQDLGSAPMSGPLSQILRSGRAIGIIGIKAPFVGTVYDIPTGNGITRYDLGPRTPRDTAATSRPIFIILIGAPDLVSQLSAQLTDILSQSMRPEGYHAILFAFGPIGRGGGNTGPTGPIRLAVPHDAPGMIEVRRSYFPPGVPAYLIRSNQRPVDLPIDEQADNALMPPGFAAGGLDVDERIWFGFKEGACVSKWRILGDDGHPPLAKLATNAAEQPVLELFPGGAPPRGASPAASLHPGLKYFVSVSVRAHMIEPGKGTTWLNDWNLSQDSVDATLAARPRFFPALNLQVISRMLEKILEQGFASDPQRQAVAHISLVFDLE